MKDYTKLYKQVNKNIKYGYYELADKYRKPMEDFYKEEYYQNDCALYKKEEYDEVDLRHKHFFCSQKEFIFKKEIEDKGESYKNAFLDIGAGEGYTLAFFSERNWNVTGIDFSSCGIENHNPAMLKNLKQGDFYQIIEGFISNKIKFDFINADNLLEHLPNPQLFFEKIKSISYEDTILCVTVPNDFSLIQKLAYDLDEIDEPFWVTAKTSEHFNYFSVDSLSLLAKEKGFETITAIADWPIDFFLLNKHTNYRVDPSLGHDCHVAGTILENLLYDKSMEKAVAFFEAMAANGIGREISLYFRNKE